MNLFKIYKSSAGSGKTFALVKEYLLLVLNRPADFRHTLAITFTNKASEEMKSRILSQLMALSEGTANEMSVVLQKELPDFDLSKRAKEVLNLLLHDYSSFAVCTIDSFFQKILRSLSREMNLPMRFELELDQQAVITEITASLMEEIGKDEALTEWMTQMAIEKINDDRDWKLENDIAHITQELFKEQFSEENKSVDREKIKSFTNDLFKIKNDFEKRMKELGAQARKAMTEAGFEVADFSYGTSGVAGYLQKLVMKIPPDAYQPGKRVLEAAGDPAKWFKKKHAHENELLHLVETSLSKILNEILKEIDLHYKRYMTSIEVMRMIYVFGIINDIDLKLRKFRNENKVVMISDAVALLNKFIGNSDTSFVYEKAGIRYKNILIDEFQDTSDLQWNNLLPVVLNSLSGGDFAMIVGDAKQSIYRWRGGNMNLILQQVKKDLKGFRTIIREENLSTNFRSKKNIVDFNNDFFSHASVLLSGDVGEEIKSDMTLAYNPEDAKQHVSSENNSGGYVCVNFIDPEKNNGEDDLHWKDVAKDKMLDALHQLEEKKYLLSDIAILVRSNREGNEIANFLFENGYKKIISPDSLLLSNSLKVQLLLSAFQYLSDRENSVSRTELLFLYLKYFKRSTTNSHAVFTDFQKNKKSTKKTKNKNLLFEARDFDSDIFNSELPEEFVHNQTALSKFQLYDLAENLVRIFKLHESTDAYLLRFLDVILEQSQKYQLNIRQFLEWWEIYSEKFSVVIPETENAIRIMTIHKSKGLQFPAVIVPYTDWSMEPKAGTVLWASADEEPFSEFSKLPVLLGEKLSKTFFENQYKQEVIKNYLDNLNLLYVAFTRAEKYLMIAAPLPGNETLKKTSQLIYQSIIGNELLKKNFNDDESKFESGELEELLRTEKTSEEFFIMKNFLSNHWQDKLHLSTSANDLSRVLQGERNEKINYGILIHKILSAIKTTDDVASAVDKIYLEGWIKEEQRKELKEKMDEIFSSEEIRKFFQPGFTLMRESELLLTTGEILRPDRVLIDHDKAIIIDFKTGKEKIGDTKQINLYADTLRQMNFSEIEKYLIYITEKKVVKVGNGN